MRKLLSIFMVITVLSMLMTGCSGDQKTDETGSDVSNETNGGTNEDTGSNFNETVILVWARCPSVFVFGKSTVVS